MDFREYKPDLQETLRTFGDYLRTTIWTSAPAIVSKDSDGKSVQAQLSVKGTNWDAKGKATSVNYPLVDTAVPVFTGGGRGETKAGDIKKDTSLVITHPIKKGDEVAVSFAMHGYDQWHENGGVQEAQGFRRHDLSDAVVHPQIRSKPNDIPNINTDEMHVRSGHGNHTMAVHPKNGTNHKSMDPDDKANEKVTDPYNKAVNYYRHGLHPSGGVTSSHSVRGEGTANKIEHSDTLTHDGGYVRQVENNTHFTTHHKITGITHSADNGQHVINLKDGIKHTTPDVHSITAKKGHVVAANTTITGAHTVSESGKYGKELTVGSVMQSGSILTGGIKAGGTIVSSLAIEGGGLSTGALEVAADKDGGLVQATLGFLANIFAKITGTLHVTGDTTLDSNLSVGGSSTIPIVDCPMHIQGSVNVDGGIAVVGDTVLGGALTLTKVPFFNGAGVAAIKLTGADNDAGAALLGVPIGGLYLTTLGGTTPSGTYTLTVRIV